MYDQILVPTDGSDAAERAVGHAIDLATRYDARIHALYVVDTASYAALEGASITVADAFRSEGEDAVERVAADASEAGIEAETAIRDGSPARSILDYASDADADLIVMGTHGRSGLDRYLLGSVTERVVRSAPAPVLTIRDDEEVEEE